MLIADYTSRFLKDVKRLNKKRKSLDLLAEVINLVIADTPESRDELLRRHNMHILKGEWLGSHECHIANTGDWLLIWRASDTHAVFQRTGTHDELFGH